MTILVGVAAAVAAVAIIGWLLSRRRARARRDRTGQIVIQAFGGAWAERFDRTAAELNAALFADADESLRRLVHREVGVIDLCFALDGAHGEVTTTITVNYAGEQQRSTARLTLKWDDVPYAVRADLMRGDGATAYRQWRAIS